MKNSLYWVAALFTLLALCTQAQDSSPQTASDFTLTDERTDTERIQFLLDVANSYITDEDWASAINAYERILEIDPNHLKAKYIVSHTYISAKQYAKAEQSLLELTAAYPEDFKLWNNLAWLYATAEDPNFRSGPKAIKYAHEAMLLAPEDHHVWSTLAEAYYVNGEYKKAYRAVNQMAALAQRYGKGVTKEAVDEYNDQIKKCKLALDTYNALHGIESE